MTDLGSYIKFSKWENPGNWISGKSECKTNYRE